MKRKDWLSLKKRKTNIQQIGILMTIAKCVYINKIKPCWTIQNATSFKDNERNLNAKQNLIFIADVNLIHLKSQH